MRKQTKLVAVLSAAALLALGASMTSFAAGWEKDDEGIWHYYDADGDMVESEWKKDGGKWFYLDEDGNMLTDSWVDDEYYVDENGAMLVNAWKYTLSEEDVDDPDEDGEHWYYFNNKGKKVSGDSKKINGKTYLFNSEGEMQYGWQVDGGEAYYYGSEDDGARVENQWLWLEKSGLLSDVDEDEQDKVLGCDENDKCDDEGWYWFQGSGKAYHGKDKKKINGKWYMFNEHGQMLYEWINSNSVNRPGSNAQLDGNLATSANAATVGEMVYYDYEEDGSRVTGWREIAGSQDMRKDGDTNWYYFDDGVAEHATVATGGTDDANIQDGTTPIKRARIKVEGKYFCFDEFGRMKTGLQYIPAQGEFYFFDEDGYQKAGKVNSVECEDDDYAFYFINKNGKNGQGYTGDKDGYLYFNGKRLEADDDYRFYYVDGNIYLVNTKGKIQKNNSAKKYDDIENKDFAGKEIYVTTGRNGVLDQITIGNTTTTAATLENEIEGNAGLLDTVTNGTTAADVIADRKVSVPFIQLYGNCVYSYKWDGTQVVETWIRTR